MNGSYLAVEAAQQHRRNAERRQQYPDRVRAVNAVTYALKTGRLVRQPCEVCGDWAEAHHEDYAKPLDVQWLCPTHHKRHHAKKRI